MPWVSMNFLCLLHLLFQSWSWFQASRNWQKACQGSWWVWRGVGSSGCLGWGISSLDTLTAAQSKEDTQGKTGFPWGQALGSMCMGGYRSKRIVAFRKCRVGEILRTPHGMVPWDSVLSIPAKSVPVINPSLSSDHFLKQSSSSPLSNPNQALDPGSYIQTPTEVS